MRRLRNKVASIQGSGAPADNPNPPGSSLTVDDIGFIEVIFADVNTLPGETAFFDIAAATAETSPTPTDAALLDLAVTQAEAPTTPTDAQTFALDLVLAEAPTTPTETTFFDLDATTAETSSAPTEGTLALDVASVTESPSNPYSGQIAQALYATTGAGTWVAPANVFWTLTEVWAGGGGGSNGTATASGGAGGGGAYSRGVVEVVPGTTYNLNVAVGGSPGASGTNGSDSWFNSTSVLLAKGGINGGGRTGGSAASGIGDVKFSGGNGGAGGAGTGGGGAGGGAGDAAVGTNGTAGGVGSTGVGGAGGSVGGGRGGDGGAAVSGGVGGTGAARGGGGGGGGASPTAPGNGGSGARGEVRITFPVYDPNTIVLKDSFDRADDGAHIGTADSGQTWTNEAEHSGVWIISGNGAQKGSDDGVGNRSVQASVDTGTANYRFGAVVNILNSPGIVVRGISGGDCALRLRADVANNSYFASKRVGGVDSFIGTWISSGVTAGVHLLELECFADQIIFYLDTVLRFSYTIPATDLATFAGASRVGLWSTFGDFSSYKSVIAHSL